ncbi:MAG TPA: dTDP-4-dehydrorhamnose reductase [Anaerolineae bacterium]|nr:dTDP-4-dehydrorhamnose reductase [Anaerolineae bacterium]
MKIVLFGKDGQLGWEMQHILPSLGEVIALGRKELDISDIPALQTTLKQIKPTLIINASAYTEVDRAETESELAYTVNALAPGLMAESARKLQAVFIHYSTDYIFDGTSNIPYKENNMPRPLNVYGKSKLKGEENIYLEGDAFLIFRTSWAYNIRGNNFVTKVLRWARESKSLKIVSDQISNPTWVRDLARTTFEMLSHHPETLFEYIKERRGVYHLAGNGYTSRFEWAREILANASTRTEQPAPTIEPATSDEFNMPARRPRFTALDCLKFEETFGLRLPDWQTSLQTAMQD